MQTGLPSSALWVLKVFSLLTTVVVAAVVLIHWARTRISPRQTLGLILDRRSAFDFVMGILTGAAAMLGTVWVERWVGLLHLNAFSLSGHHLLAGASSYLASAFLEELISRGLLLSGLILIVRRRWLAVALMAMVFGLLHATNSHATALSLLSNSLGGVIYAIAYLGSRRLWLGSGIHFAWNFVQGPIFGLPVSGGVVPWGGLFTASIEGPVWLTGGRYGPEGGLISIVFRVLALGLVMLWLFHRPVDARTSVAQDRSRRTVTH